MDENKVILGLSGGVDSAAAALLLKEKGMDITALYFDVTQKGDKDAGLRAEKLAAELQIPFLYRNVWERFEQIIVTPFCKAYQEGCTPMPCIVCNPYIKWKLLQEEADKIGAKWLATGHYARITEENGVFYGAKAANRKKDQSYMLARLGQDILSRALFPLENFQTKEEVRSYVLSKGISLPEDIGESQDICFISGNYKDFLAEKGYLPVPGFFVDEKGNILGKHNGYSGFTIGQSKGFGMGFNKKMYVKAIHPESAEVVLCENENLFTRTVPISVCSFAKYGECGELPEEYKEKEFDVKIRYAALPSPAVLHPSDNHPGRAELLFRESQRAPAPGQYAVFYSNEKVIGCGIIT